jgi:hypothetical protein
MIARSSVRFFLLPFDEARCYNVEITQSFVSHFLMRGGVPDGNPDNRPMGNATLCDSGA